MREIKFRAWDKEEKRMFYPRILEQVPKTGIWIRGRQVRYDTKQDFFSGDELPIGIGCETLETPKSMRHGNNVILMQFVGLKDGKGKEIYEDDILEVSEYYVGDSLLKPDRAMVVFEEGSFIAIGKEWHDLENIMKNRYAHVIGNVHGNIELMK